MKQISLFIGNRNYTKYGKKNGTDNMGGMINSMKHSLRLEYEKFEKKQHNYNFNEDEKHLNKIIWLNKKEQKIININKGKEQELLNFLIKKKEQNIKDYEEFQRENNNKDWEISSENLKNIGDKSITEIRENEIKTVKKKLSNLTNKIKKRYKTKDLKQFKEIIKNQNNNTLIIEELNKIYGTNQKTNDIHAINQINTYKELITELEPVKKRKTYKNQTLTKELIFKIPNHNDREFEEKELNNLLLQIGKFYKDFDIDFATIHNDENNRHIHIFINGFNNKTKDFDIFQYEKTKLLKIFENHKTKHNITKEEFLDIEEMFKNTEKQYKKGEITKEDYLEEKEKLNIIIKMKGEMFMEYFKFLGQNSLINDDKIITINRNHTEEKKQHTKQKYKTQDSKKISDREFNGYKLKIKNEKELLLKELEEHKKSLKKIGEYIEKNIKRFENLEENLVAGFKIDQVENNKKITETTEKIETIKKEITDFPHNPKQRRK